MVICMSERKTVAEKIDDFKCQIYSAQKTLDKYDTNSPEFLENAKALEKAETKLRDMQDLYDVWNKLLERSREKNENN